MDIGVVKERTHSQELLFLYFSHTPMIYIIGNSKLFGFPVLVWNIDHYFQNKFYNSLSLDKIKPNTGEQVCMKILVV